MSPDTFRLTKALAHAHTQTFSLDSCASAALCLPFTAQDSTKAEVSCTAAASTITFPLTETDGPRVHNKETAGKVRKQSGGIQDDYTPVVSGAS